MKRSARSTTSPAWAPKRVKGTARLFPPRDRRPSSLAQSAKQIAAGRASVRPWPARLDYFHPDDLEHAAEAESTPKCLRTPGVKELSFSVKFPSLALNDAAALLTGGLSLVSKPCTSSGSWSGFGRSFYLCVCSSNHVERTALEEPCAGRFQRPSTP